MAQRQRNYITLPGVLVGTNLERNMHGVLHLNGTGVAKPLDLVWARVLHLDQLELGAYFFTCQVMTTPSIDDDLDGPSIDAGLGMKDVALLVFLLVMLESQDHGDNKSGT